jgi:WD40 repeat protein
MLENESYEYRVGGSLPEYAPSYVVRQADRDFYSWLKSGDFCYVFNSRQMGKTSLLVRVLQQLRGEGIACTTIDVSGRGSGEVQPEQWYAGIVYTLIKDFKLANPLQFMKSWWQERAFLPPAQRLAEMIETILLPNTNTQIIIFIDEIDSMLSLNFSTDDFFALIRSCYDKRANNANYNRLTFSLIGVARPSDLITDKRRTPFNIGRAIELAGFTATEAYPLQVGLKKCGDQPQEILNQILSWTNGQPFLTQKLCYLLSISGIVIKAGEEAAIIKNLVQREAIEDWESKDNPPHFKTISTRLTANETKAGGLLGLYQQVLSKTVVVMADQPEVRGLQLAGIVVKFGNELRVANPIYATIFDRSWVSKQLADLRPHTNAIREWLESGKKDTSRLLRGQALEDVLIWSKGKNLSNLDNQFISACREQQIHEASQVILQQRIKQLRLLSAIASIFAISAVFFAIQASNEKEKSQIAAINAKNSLNQVLLKSENSKNSLESLIGTVEAARLFKEQTKFFDQDSRQKLQQETETNLRQAINGTLERNRLQHCKEVTGSVYSPDGKFIASVSKDKNLRVWQPNGNRLKQISHGQSLSDLVISSDSRKIITVGESPQVEIWNPQGEPIEPSLKTHHPNDQFNRVAITPDAKYIAAATSNPSKNSEVVIWSIETGEILKVLKSPFVDSPLVNRTHNFRDLKFSLDGKFLTAASTDNTIKVWQWQTDKNPQVLTGHQDWVYSLSFSPDSKWLVSSGGGSDKSMKIWSIQGELFELKKTIKKAHNDAFYVAFNPVTGQLATTASAIQSAIKIWDVEQIIAHPKSVITSDDWSSLLLTTIEMKTSVVKSINYSPDGKRIILSKADAHATIWEPNSSSKKSINVSDLRLKKIVYSHNGKYIATGGIDKLIKIWNSDGTLLRTIDGHQDWVTGLSFSPNNQLLASGSEDNTVKIWKIVDGSLVHTLKHSSFAYDVSFSLDNRYLASVGNDSKLKIWDVASGTLFKEFNISSNDFWSWRVSFSPNGKYLANTTDQGIDIRETTNFTKIRILGDDDKSVKTVYGFDFSPDGQTIASVGANGQTIIWNILDGKSTHRYEPPISLSDNIKFSANSQEFLTTGDNEIVKFWSLEKAMHVRFETPIGSNIALSPDRKTLATTNQNGVMRLWDLAQFEQKYLSLDKSYEKGSALLQEYTQFQSSAANCENIY